VAENPTNVKPAEAKRSFLDVWYRDRKIWDHL